METFGIRTDDGLNIAIATAGEGPPCIAIHGFAEGAYVWTDLAGSTPNIRLLCPSLRGHGPSDWCPKRDYSVRRHVADLLAMVDTLGLGEVALIGHSLGARLALELARAGRFQVLGIALIDYAPASRPEVTRQIALDLRESSRGFSSTSDYMRTLSERRPLLNARTLARVADAHLRWDASGRYVRTVDPSMILERPHASEDLQDLLLQVGGLPCPKLLVRGEWSAVMRPADLQSMSMRLGGADCAIVPRAGHGLILDNPQGFVTAMRDFVAHVAGRQGRAPSDAIEATAATAGASCGRMSSHA